VGVVMQILPTEEKVVLKLPFGLMYAHLRRVMCWGVPSSQEEAIDRKAVFADTLDAAADRTLAAKWKALRYVITLPAECSRGVASVLGSLTDAEQAANVAAAAEGAPDEIAPSAEAAAAASFAEAGDPEEADPENDNRLLFSISQGSMGGVDLMQQYHLPVVADSQHLRSNMQADMHEAAGYGIRDPRLVMGPPQALVNMVKEKLCQLKRELHLCPGALGGNTATQTGVTGSLTWDANTEVMKKGLQERAQMVAQLEDELHRSLSEISSSRRRAAKLAVETSALRMNMFTRRVRHRNNLSDRGMNPSGTFPNIGGEPMVIVPATEPRFANSSSTDDLAGMDKEPAKATKASRANGRGEKNLTIATATAAAAEYEGDNDRRESKRSRNGLGIAEDRNDDNNNDKDSDSDNGDDNDELRQINMPSALTDAEAVALGVMGVMGGLDGKGAAAPQAEEKVEVVAKEKPKQKRKRAA